MLYFSKFRIFTILIFTLILSFFTISNFVNIDNETFGKKINLGLDLQGGSYLLLEIDNKPVFSQKLQSKLIEIKKYFKEKKILLKDSIISDNKISFVVNNKDIETVNKILDDEDSQINPYFTKFPKKLHKSE